MFYCLFIIEKSTFCVNCSFFSVIFFGAKFANTPKFLILLVIQRITMKDANTNIWYWLQ